MATGTDADLTVLGAIAVRLREAGDSLDAAAHGAPTSVDAGEVTGLMCGVVAHLAESAGNLVVGLRQAGQQVSECRAAYESRDATASAAFQAIL